MSKSDTIEAIVNLNPTAKPEFLAEFSNDDLHQYLHRLTFLPHTADEEADTTGTIEIGDFHESLTESALPGLPGAA